MLLVTENIEKYRESEEKKFQMEIINNTCHLDDSKKDNYFIQFVRKIIILRSLLEIVSATITYQLP